MSEPKEVKIKDENHLLKDKYSSEISREIENNNGNDYWRY